MFEFFCVASFILCMFIIFVMNALITLKSNDIWLSERIKKLEEKNVSTTDR